MEWYTFKSAGEKINKSHSYFHSILKNHPEYFLKGTFKKEGRIWLISEEGIDEVVKKTKKAGDHLRAVTLNVVYKTKNRLCFCPFIF